MNYKHYSDFKLEQTLKDTVREENKIKTQVLHLLAEVERRRLYSREYPSLFEYCVKVLKYSSGAAQRRIDSMRALRLIPELEQKIITGELNFTAIAQAQSFFRQEAKTGKPYNLEMKKEVLVKLENKSTRECIQELVKISPQSVPQEKRRELTVTQTELKIALDKTLLNKLDQIKAFLSHSHPGMTDQELIAYMAEFVLKKLEPAQKTNKKKSGARPSLASPTEKSNISSDQKRTDSDAAILPAPVVKIGTSTKAPLYARSNNSRYIPSTIKHEVYMRDKGCCSYINPKTKQRCNSKYFLEYDHIVPFAKNGKTTASNLRLLCRSHNQRAAIQHFGFSKINGFVNRIRPS